MVHALAAASSMHLAPAAAAAPARKMQGLPSLLLSAALGAATTAPSPAVAGPLVVPEAHLQHLLFYTCATKEVANQCEESYTLDQVGVATTGFSNNLTTIAAGARAHPPIRTLFSVHDTFIVNGKGLRPDWPQAWQRLQATLAPLIEAKAVVGFFVGDELFPGKITLTEFTTILGALQQAKMEWKAKGTTLITWENEGGTGWVANFKTTGIPKALDVISLDDYYMGTTPQSEADAHRRFYEASIYPLLHPHQSVFLVPGAFATHTPGRAPSPPPPKPILPPANSTGCARGPAARPHAYGNAHTGSFCCPGAVSPGGKHCVGGGECCLSPGR
jgi:hypothetical protein